jgi:hypothetical protein
MTRSAQLVVPHEPTPNSGLQPTWTAALPCSELRYHGVAVHAAEPEAVRRHEMNCPRCNNEMLDGEAVMHHPSFWRTFTTGVSYKRLYFRPSTPALESMLHDESNNDTRTGDVLALRSDRRSPAHYCTNCKGMFVE